jgi:hypothetical protein
VISGFRREAAENCALLGRCVKAQKSAVLILENGFIISRRFLCLSLGLSVGFLVNATMSHLFHKNGEFYANQMKRTTFMFC